MPTQENDIADWLFRIKNKTLLRAAVNLSCVRSACRFLTEQEKGSREGLSFYEMRMLADAIGALQGLHGNVWENFPFPQYSTEELKEFNPHPKTIMTYCEILLQYINVNLRELDKEEAK